MQKDNSKITIAIADDHAIIRDGLTLILSLHADFTVAWQAVDGEDALFKCRASPPDVLLLDLSMPKRTGVEVIAQLRVDNSEKKTAIVLLSGSLETHSIANALRAGADGYVPKSKCVDEVVAAICCVHAGGTYVSTDIAQALDTAAVFGSQREITTILQSLTVREHETLRLIGQGHATIEIAAKLNISPGTVRKHRENLSAKLGLHTPAQTVAFAMRHLG